MNCYIEISQFIFQMTLLRRKKIFKFIIIIYFQMILRAFEQRIRFAKNIFDQTYYSRLKNIFALILIVSICAFIIINCMMNLILFRRMTKIHFTMIMNFIIDISSTKNLYINKFTMRFWYWWINWQST